MTIRHHPGDEVLLELAAGRLSAGPALLASVHAEMCPQCRERLRALEAAGGVLMESLPAETLRADALARTLEAVDALPASQQSNALPVAASPSARPAWPAGAPWPKALQGRRFTPWKWIGPGMSWSRMAPQRDAAANVFLLRIAPGRSLPAHTHHGLEWTQVLHGAFHDGHDLFGPGDFDGADGGVHHQPVVQGQSDCICLAAVDGRLLFDGRLARWVGALVGM
ncbi:ChrR family anti-sigma-E factor [Paracidovorax konjaci]|uniref:Anti-ECFsigma factor, ChrR n=1 Tax=Paracidovorax konjaci TaxID=32040 RepID=A0A1I1XTX1_9BURK|nr:ChrR family anti-sigma-E factor [Paracidovorax konjaci]SFE10734.1 anti-ECFsigma factor, ChrR [Paracidovorax konjaci]